MAKQRPESYRNFTGVVGECERCKEPFMSYNRNVTINKKRFCSERCRKAAESQRARDRKRALKFAQEDARNQS